MARLEKDAVGAVVFLLIILQSLSLESKKPKDPCPIGYKLSIKEDICYALKNKPERFSDKFTSCSGKSFKYNEYSKINFPKDEIHSIWTDYKSLYPGGPFVDTSDNLEVLDTTYQVIVSPHVAVDEQLCVVIDPLNNFTAVRCDEEHYRYCFVEKYSRSEPEPCEELADGERLAGPVAACVARVAPAAGRGSVRATYPQAQAMCRDRGATLLGHAWMYYNYFDTDEPKPLDFFADRDRMLLRFYSDNDTVVASSEWHFNDSSAFSANGSYVAIGGSHYWYLVNGSDVFISPTCEKLVPLKTANLTVTFGSDGLIKLLVTYDPPLLDSTDKLDKEDIKCFTDSVKYYPSKVTVDRAPTDDDSSLTRSEFILKPLMNGYYWCTHDDSKRFHITESNKTLYVQVKEATENIYAVKIVHSSKYNLGEINTLLREVWTRKLKEYVFYYTEMTKSTTNYDALGEYNDFTVMKYRNKHELRVGENIIQSTRLKRLYLDATTVLLHVELHPDMKPVKPGRWEGLYIQYMKPVYYCDKDKGNKLSLGMSRVGSECKLYRCVGDYNNGVDTVMEAQEGCYLPTTVTMTTAVNVSAHVTTPAPPALPKPTTLATPRTHELSRASNGNENSSEEFVTDVLDVPLTTVVAETPYGVTTVSNEVLTATSPSKPPKPTRPPFPPPTTVTDPPTTQTYPPTTMPPQEQLDQVIKDLELLLNTTDTFVVEDIEEAFTQVDEILAFEELHIPGNLLHLLDDIGARINLNGTDNTTTVRENIALLVADAQPDLPVRGLRVAVRDGTDVFNNDTFEIIRDDINSSQLSTEASEVVVSLPDSVSTTTHRVSFVVFRNDRAFQGGHESYAVNSRVLSVNVNNITEFPPGEVIDIHLMPIDEAERNQSRACAYWQFNEDGVSGNWSQDGCTFIRASRAGQLDTCRCDHLTHFAEILVPRTVFSAANEAALEILSIIGCCVSILSLILVGVTALLFRSWRRDYSNKIWLQLCLSILILSICFLVIVYVQFHETDILCLLTGVVLHYSVLSSFCWMLVAAVLSYRRLVLVFTRDASHKLLRASAFAWGAPCAVVGILLSVAPHSYGARFEDKSPSGAFCYPSGLALWLAVYAPIALMLLANWTLFILIVRSVFGSRRPQNHGHGAANDAFRCATVSCLLVFMFGLPWLFGLFSFNIVAAYLFTIFVTFQGFVLFFFFVVGNKKTRDLWLNKLKIKQTRKIPVTSSTYTNRSTGANVPPRGSQAPASMEAKASKPRSLSSSDNSRFS